MHYDYKNGILIPINNLYEKKGNYEVVKVNSVYDNINGVLKEDFKSSFFIVKDGIFQVSYTTPLTGSYCSWSTRNRFNLSGASYFESDKCFRITDAGRRISGTSQWYGVDNRWEIRFPSINISKFKKIHFEIYWAGSNYRGSGGYEGLNSNGLKFVLNGDYNTTQAQVWEGWVVKSLANTQNVTENFTLERTKFTYDISTPTLNNIFFNASMYARYQMPYQISSSDIRIYNIYFTT